MRGAALTQKLLAFGRKQLLDVKPLDINEMLMNLETMLHRLIREDITLQFSVSDHPLVVEADCLQLEQIVINLVTNARDAMPDGGQLSISTGAARIDPLIAAQHGIKDSGDVDFAVMRIADRGIGMDSETQRRIFEPFFTTKETGKGTGLGLAVVYGIIRQHKGIIRVKSMPEKGTEFIIYFPLLKRSQNGAVAPRSGDHACRGGGETILVAEDQEYLRMMKKDILESYGYKVITAEDGEAAVEAFKLQPDRISLILLDMVMPKKRGIDTYVEISRISPEIKVLFITGYGVGETERAELAGKQHTILLKPFSSFDLLKKVRQLLDGD
jgi:CheY-like chemotaxis protein